MKKLFYFLLIMSTSNIYSQEFLNPEPLFDPAPYGLSHVAIVPQNTRLIFVTGQGGISRSIRLFLYLTWHLITTCRLKLMR